MIWEMLLDSLVIFSLPILIIILLVLLFLARKSSKLKSVEGEIPSTTIKTEMWNVNATIKSSDIVMYREKFLVPGSAIYVIAHKKTLFTASVTEAIYRDYDGEKVYLHSFDNNELMGVIKAIAETKKNCALIIDDYYECLTHNPNMVAIIANLIKVAANHDVEVKVMIIGSAKIFNEIKLDDATSGIDCEFMDIRAIEDMVFAQRRATLGKAAH